MEWRRESSGKEGGGCRNAVQACGSMSPGQGQPPKAVPGPWGGGVARTPQTPSPRAFRAHPVPYPTRSTALSSSNPTPHLQGGPSGELLYPLSTQSPTRVNAEGKSPLTDFLGRPRGFLPGVTAAF